VLQGLLAHLVIHADRIVEPCIPEFATVRLPDIVSGFEPVFDSFPSGFELVVFPIGRLGAEIPDPLK